MTDTTARADDFRTDINPALRYYEGFILNPNLPEADFNYLATNNYWRGQKLPDHVGELLARYDQPFKMVRRATYATAPCDWGIDMSDGSETYLPHLARIKGVVQIAQLRAVWALQHGKQSEACEELRSALAIGV